MGIVFGKTGVSEPSYKVLATVSSGAVPYEIRSYGQRFVAETEYTGTGRNSADSPFRSLARYIGVFGEAENKGGQKVSMTAPVAMSPSSGGGGTKLSMTSPVSMKESDGSERRVMQFFLPEEYTTLESIPVPTNSAVHIRAVPGATGAVYRFSGSMDMGHARDLALKLGAQLREDGVASASDDYVLENYEFWGYNPPVSTSLVPSLDHRLFVQIASHSLLQFTLPMFRRNEIWLELDASSVEHLVNGVNVSEAN